MKRLALIFLSLFMAVGARAIDTSNFRAVIMGSENAPITIVEYTSLTCHHCADFHLYVLPVIKQKYVNTGKLRWIVMPFPMDKDAMMAFELVNSLPEDQRADGMARMFSAQKQWIGKTADVAGQALGLSPEQSKKAIEDKDVETALLAGSYHAQKETGVTVTPTFYLNDRKVEGAMTIEEFEKTFPELNNPDGNVVVQTATLTQ